MKASANNNRRSNERYKTLLYTAAIQRHGLLGYFNQPKEAAVINFNRTGMAVCSESRFNVGDKIKMKLHSVSEQVNDICAIVRYTKKHRHEYFIGLQFVEADDFTTAISNAAQSTLAGVEQVIKHQLA